jgi:hypothetical protein
MSGDVNAFTNEDCMLAGKEFGESLEGCIIIIRKALWTANLIPEHWYAHSPNSELLDSNRLDMTGPLDRLSDL